MDDETLDRLVVDADPARMPVDAGLTLRQLQARDRIMAGTYAPAAGTARRRARWRIGAPVALLAACLAVLLIVVPGLHPQAAAAHTPPPLVFTPTGQTPQELLRMVERDVLRSDAGPAAPLRQSRTVGWYLQLTQRDGATTAAVISPQVTTFSWGEDLSGRVTIVAGTPYWTDESDRPIPQADALAPGTVISDMRFARGGFEPPVPAMPGQTGAALAGSLAAAGYSPGGDAADLIDAISTFFSCWTLTSRQQATILRILLDRSDVQVLGTARDRASRPVTGIATDSTRFPGTRKILLVSRDSGRIVGMETITMKASDAVPAGSVIAYSLWDVDR